MSADAERRAKREFSDADLIDAARTYWRNLESHAHRTAEISSSGDISRKLLENAVAGNFGAEEEWILTQAKSILSGRPAK